MSEAFYGESLQNLALQVKKICREYGLYGNVIYYAPSPFTRPDHSNRNRFYIVAGTSQDLQRDTLPSWLDPEEIIRRNSRNCKLFYPAVWAVDLSSGVSFMDAIDQLVEYAKRTEFLATQCAQYELALPSKLRLSEVNHLITQFDKSLWSADQPRMQKRYQSTLDRFFKGEKRLNRLYRAWMDYYRSEKFPDGKGPLAKLTGFLRRQNPQVKHELLQKTNDNLRKLQLQEYEYQYFRDFMSTCYPDVSFAVGKREVVDHGLPPLVLQNKVPVRNVTWEEYAAVRKERFAEEGYNALADMNPSRWEFRDIYYRAIDEPIIASVYNAMSLQYAKCNALDELEQYGEMAMEDIPASNFMNFVSLAKANGVRFYIDTKGDYAVPSFQSIHVLYNTCQADKMSGIVSRLLHDKVAYSHTLDFRPSLENQIEHSQQLSQCDRSQTPTKHLFPERD